MKSKLFQGARRSKQHDVEVVDIRLSIDGLQRPDQQKLKGVENRDSYVKMFDDDDGYSDSLLDLRGKSLEVLAH